jgi:hypothetical protein
MNRISNPCDCCFPPTEGQVELRKVHRNIRQLERNIDRAIQGGNDRLERRLWHNFDEQQQRVRQLERIILLEKEERRLRNTTSFLADSVRNNLSQRRSDYRDFVMGNPLPYPNELLNSGVDVRGGDLRRDRTVWRAGRRPEQREEQPPAQQQMDEPPVHFQNRAQPEFNPYHAQIIGIVPSGETQ